MTPPTLRLVPHSSSDGLCFGTGFTGFDGNDLFIAQFGQQESVGDCYGNFSHKNVRTRLSKTGVTWTAGPVTDFVTGQRVAPGLYFVRARAAGARVMLVD